MANASLHAAFERMWQHSTAKIAESNNEVKNYVNEKISEIDISGIDITPESIGAVSREEVGDPKELFQVQFELQYDDTETGIKYYWLYFDGLNGGPNLELLGKTIVVQTYADINMEYEFGGVESEQVYYQLNPNAGDLTNNPESGICNIEIQLPNKNWGAPDCWLVIPYLNNPYVTFNARIKKDSVWEEIKKLEKNTIVAQGEFNGQHWRKWGDGFAEIWITCSYSSDEFYVPEAGVLELNFSLPFNLVIDKSNNILDNGTCRLANQESSISAPIHLDGAWSWGGPDWSSYWSAPEGDIESVSMSLYIAGYWK